jgi:YesN/AraC family two-component response regulator
MELERPDILACMKSVAQALEQRGEAFAATLDEKNILIFIFSKIDHHEVYSIMQSLLAGYAVYMCTVQETSPDKCPENAEHVKAALNREVSGRGACKNGKLIVCQGSQVNPMEKAVRIIFEEYADKSLCIAGACARLYMSNAYFCVLFKAYTGKTFVNYLTDYRISKALEMLMDPNIQVREAAELAGFDNGNYFSKVFKKRTGMSPAEYRRRASREGSA